MFLIKAFAEPKSMGAYYRKYGVTQMGGNSRTRGRQRGIQPVEANAPRKGR